MPFQRLIEVSGRAPVRIIPLGKKSDSFRESSVSGCLDWIIITKEYCVCESQNILVSNMEATVGICPLTKVSVCLTKSLLTLLKSS